MKRNLTLLVTLLWALQTQAATYNVAVTGNDTTGDGSPGNPWRTIQKGVDAALSPGDTVSVGAGDYDEYVTTKASGSSGNPITIITTAGAELDAIRVRDHEYIVIDGFTFTGAQDQLWAGHIRVEHDSHYLTVQNCQIGPGVFAIASDWLFDSVNNTISSPSVDLVDAGFKAGGYIFAGGSGLEDFWYANHDQDFLVQSVSETTLTLDPSTPIGAETNLSAWAPIYAGVNSAGKEGIIFILTGGYGATGATISNCLFTNIFGPSMTLQGTNHHVVDNIFDNMNSYYGLRPNGYDHVITNNWWRGTRNIIYYTPTEIGSVPHPPGADWYDYSVGFIHVTGEGDNVLFKGNWLQDIPQPLGQINEVGSSYGFHWEDNVAVGIGNNLSGGRDFLTFTNNTFYRAAFDYYSALALTIGGNAPAVAADMAIHKNAFIDVGSRNNIDNEGAYGVVSATYTADENFITGPESLGFPEKTAWNEASGVNGGDPLLLNPHNPLGNDGLPFTSDDGLRPLPTSILAVNGWGALDAVTMTNNTPIAHFSISGISTGFQWYDPVDEDYNPAWVAMDAFDRPSRIRPWDTPEAIGENGVQITFDASTSIAGTTTLDTGNANITQYQWNFGDGGTATTASTTTSHTYTYGGTYRVTLTVVNSTAGTGSTWRDYRVLGDPAPVSSTTYYVDPAGNDTTGDGSIGNPWLTVQHGLGELSPGETLHMNAGEYDEQADTEIPGIIGGYITLEGDGTANTMLKQLQVHHPYYRLRNFSFKSTTPAPIFQLEFDRGAHYAHVTNVVFDPQGVELISPMTWRGPSTKPFGTDAASNCIIENVTVQNVYATFCLGMYGDDNILRHSTFKDGDMVDFLRIFGRRNIVHGSLFTNNFDGGGLRNHPDFFQSFSDLGFGSIDHLITSNRVLNCANAQITQISNSNILPEEDFGGFEFSNNIFANMGLSASCTVPNVNYYNNVFYRCNYVNKGAVLSFGVRKFDKEITLSGDLVVDDYYRAKSLSGEGTVIHDGVTYNAQDEFQAVNTTFTTTGDAYVVRYPRTYAHGTRIINNLFLDGGGDTSEITGYYGIPATLTNSAAQNLAADYNMVTKIYNGSVNQPVREDSGMTPVGGPGEWDYFRWWEPNGINGGDPGVVDKTTLNFVPAAGSILLDAGLTIASITTDIAGNSRPSGLAYDIGSYEGVSGDPEEPEPPAPPDPEVEDPLPDPQKPINFRVRAR